MDMFPYARNFVRENRGYNVAATLLILGWFFSIGIFLATRTLETAYGTVGWSIAVFCFFHDQLKRRDLL